MQTLSNDAFWCKYLKVKKEELEVSSCLNKDSFTVTCTLTFLDMKQQQYQEEKKITKMVEEMATILRTESDSVLTPLLNAMYY